jgi:hypothetical protein
LSVREGVNNKVLQQSERLDGVGQTANAVHGIGMERTFSGDLTRSDSGTYSTAAASRAIFRAASCAFVIFLLLFWVLLL